MKKQNDVVCVLFGQEALLFAPISDEMTSPQGHNKKHTSADIPRASSKLIFDILYRTKGDVDDAILRVARHRWLRTSVI